MVERINLHPEQWKVTSKERSKGRMKISIKLNKVEAEGFKNWTNAVKPTELSEDDFFKQIFFNGIEYLNQKLQDAAQRLMHDEELKKQLAASGIDVDKMEINLQESTAQQNTEEND